MSKRSREHLPSPCINKCDLGRDGTCGGCGRTMLEISTWPMLPPEERERIIQRLLASRTKR